MANRQKFCENVLEYSYVFERNEDIRSGGPTAIRPITPSLLSPENPKSLDTQARRAEDRGQSYLNETIAPVGHTTGGRHAFQ